MTIKLFNILVFIIIVLTIICGILLFKGYNYRRELVECNRGHVLGKEEAAKANVLVMQQDSIFKAQELKIDTLRTERARLETRLQRRNYGRYNG